MSIKFSDRIIAALPLQELWDDTQIIATERKSYLTKDAIKDSLRQGPVQFIMADTGQKLNFIETENCYCFWKSEVEPRLVDDPQFINFETCPENYTYQASAWESIMKYPIILLEKIH